ncbi:RanGTP-binding protein-domain-containing protein [Kickxella alabastrina]|uniref:RanGTP-binding protein-domain-containing protein n=1 Tax=Kickxella alabastrina TaxID=61397 RepID=UPI00221EE8FF|nr:RanGTP-binding protein-domain-containing protein [Kickxella alabastrina]KAI7823962.1 RanGTP-binding protein-domain-containing protein [Kickxella alabastrina]
MDQLFSSLAMQTVQLVGKAAFGAASTLALRRVNEYINRAPQTTPAEQVEVGQLQARFEAKLRVVTPAIDLIELISARGHSTMAGVLQLTHALRSEVVGFGAKLAKLENKSSDSAGGSIAADLRVLLAKIDDAVPLLNLALTTSGIHLGGTLPEGISPSRLMQASRLLARAYLRHDFAGKSGVLVGEPFVLRLYSLFVGSVRPKSRQDFTWKEEFVLCRAGLWRIASSKDDGSAFEYELRIVEDLDDGRYHEEPTEAAPEWTAKFVQEAEDRDFRPGCVLQFCLDKICSLHYTSAGSLLNIEESSSPVLVVGLRGSDSAAKSGQDTKWYAMEVVSDQVDHYSSSSASSSASSSRRNSIDDTTTQGNTKSITRKAVDSLADSLHVSCAVDKVTLISGPDATEEQLAIKEALQPANFLAHEWNQCTLSLLEYMVRLASVEMCEHMSHLEVPDEKLRLYLLSSPPPDKSNEDHGVRQTSRSASNKTLATNA